MTYADRHPEEDPAKTVRSYEPPRLTLVGNLNDLLAGTGSQETDDFFTCPANARFDDPTC
jgi:hypothetical protein